MIDWLIDWSFSYENLRKSYLTDLWKTYENLKEKSYENLTRSFQKSGPCSLWQSQTDIVTERADERLVHTVHL